MAEQSDKCESLEFMRGRARAEKGGVPDPGYAKQPTKAAADDATYTRPRPRPDPYNSPNERGSSD